MDKQFDMGAVLSALEASMGALSPVMWLSASLMADGVVKATNQPIQLSVKISPALAPVEA
jgi:hypothetical protein